MSPPAHTTEWNTFGIESSKPWVFQLRARMTSFYYWKPKQIGFPALIPNWSTLIVESLKKHASQLTRHHLRYHTLYIYIYIYKSCISGYIYYMLYHMVYQLIYATYRVIYRINHIINYIGWHLLYIKQDGIYYMRYRILG